MYDETLTVEDLHTELGFDQYAEQLQRIAGVWKALLERQTKARRDPRAMPAYKSYLTRCIHQVRDLDPLFTPAEEERAASDLVDWTAGRLVEHHMAERETSRWPPTFPAWCEQHLPGEWANLQLAMTRAFDRPSAGAVANWKRAYDEMLTRYVSGATG